jgi:hypothetical protein
LKTRNGFCSLEAKLVERGLSRLRWRTRYHGNPFVGMESAPFDVHAIQHYQQRPDLLFNERVMRSVRGLRKQIRLAMQMQTPAINGPCCQKTMRNEAWKFPRGSSAGATIGPRRCLRVDLIARDSPVDSREPDKEPDEQPTQLRCPMPTAASKDHPSWTIAAHLESLLFSPLRLRPSVFSNSYLSFVLYL